MKIQNLGLVALCAFHFQTFTQEIPDSIKNSDPVNLAYQARMDEIFENVDFSYVPTGRLYERGIPFITLEPFNGEITDSSKANLIIFSLAYASLVSMTVDETSALPDPSSYRHVMDTINPNSTVIAVAGMHQLYNTIDTNAFANGLLAVTDDNYTDVLPREASPYLDKEIFMFAPAEIKLNNPVFSLYFDSGLFYNNSGKTVDSLFMDTGMGFQAIQFDENIQMAYAEKGRKLVKIKLKYADGSVYYSHFDLIIEGRAFRGLEDVPDIAEYIFGYTLDQPSTGRGGGWIYTYLACGHERIEKPFIWAEAFNPSVGAIDANLTKDDILDRLKHSDGEVDDRRLLDYLTENGYDIIILDYDDGADYLPRTAEFIKEAIRWINLQKHSAGSSAKNIILGQSMGGVATMQALRRMELGDEDHECEKFIVFDSPIMGVNIPMTAQASLLDMATLWVNKPFSADDRMLFQYVEIIEDIVRLLYLPATRTMMVEQCDDVYLSESGFYVPDILKMYITLKPGTDEEGYIKTEHLYADHYDKIHNDMGGMPVNCEVLTIANGSVMGEDGQHEFNPGNIIVEPKINNMTIGSIIAGYLDDEIEDDDLSIFNSDVMSGTYGLLLWAVGITVFIDIKMYAMKHEDNFDYYRNTSFVKIPALIPVVFHNNRARTSTGLEIDHIAGGFFGLGNQGVFFPSGSLADDALKTFRMHTWCFTPTGSVLNYHGDGGNTWLDEPNRSYLDRNALLTTNKVRGVTGFTANPLTPIFDNDPEGDEYMNTAHTWFTSQNSRYLIYHLIGSNELVGIDLIDFGKRFNYGKSDLTPATITSGTPIRTSSILDHSITVNGSQFNVNADDLIGLTPSPYAPDDMGNASANSHFVMYLGKLCDPTPKVTLELEASSIMNIGDGDTRTGSVLVQDGHEIIVNSTSIIHIKSGSTLKLNNGGTLFIEEGGKVIIEDGAALIIENGATLEYYEGAEIQLNGENSQLVIEGFLHLNEEADFMVLHEGVNSGMIVINNPEGSIYGESGSTFRIIGDGNDDPMLTITEHGLLTANVEMEQMMFASCQVIMRSEEDYGIKSFAPFTSGNVTYIVQDNSVLADIHPTIGIFNSSSISSSDFTDVKLKCEDVYGVDGVFARVNNSSFDFTYHKNDDMLSVKNGNLYMHGCDFTNYTHVAVRLNDLTAFSQINYSNFNCPLTAEAYGIYKSSESELFVRNCTFFGGWVGVYNNYGQVDFKCSTFSNHTRSGLYGGFNSRIELSTNYNAGYNSFDNIGENSIRLQNSNFLSISNGYNYFWNDGTAAPTIKGTMSVALPAGLVVPGNHNQWNGANTVPAASEMALTNEITDNPINYNLTLPESATCGALNPDSPVVVQLGGGSGNYLPVIPVTGQSQLLRLDSALAFARKGSILWDSTASDLTAITRYYDILTYPYSTNNLANFQTQYYLNQAYAEMKFTIGHAIADSVILKSENTSSFSVPVSNYVEVLNLLTNSETISRADYVKRFYLELDKAHLFRALGHTATGLDILQNTNFCQLDSTERVVLNHWLFVFEEEVAKQAFGSAGYGIDTTFTDSSSYVSPTASRATEFYFGSVINSVSSVTYRTCSGSKAPEDSTSFGDNLMFTLYPNPSNGFVRLDYSIPTEGQNELVVYTLDGKEIYRKNLKGGENSETIDITQVESGLYIYKVTVNAEVAKVGRIVVTR